MNRKNPHTIEYQPLILIQRQTFISDSYFISFQECLASCQDLIEDALQLNVTIAQENEVKLGAEQPTTPTDLQAVDLL